MSATTQPTLAAKPIPRSRPTPIAGAAGSPARQASPGGASFASSFARRAGRSYGFDANGHSAEDNNWRARGVSVTGTSVGGPGSAAAASAATGETPSSVAGSAPKGRGPERTVGGFEKREVRGGGGASALSSTKERGERGERGDVKSAALSHVPCRFFKAGACTAGSSCQFSHDIGAKKEVCQWFLKGDCKFGHKCALAHVRPGEPMSMDRRNKKEQQRAVRERGDGKGEKGEEGDVAGTSAPTGTSVGAARAAPIPTPISHPVPIKSAISASLHSGSMHSPSRFASSPLREPYGPPSAVVAGSPSAGFNQGQGRPLSGAAGFGASPSRPSPLSSSFNARTGVSLKGSSLINAHSPLRPPTNSGAFSSSFSHASASGDKASGQLSASFAGRSIWAHSETPEEPLSPARRPVQPPVPVVDDVVFDDEAEHGAEDLLPSSLTDLLTPKERARRMSRTDSRESYAAGGSASPSRAAFINPHQYVGAERLAQSASAAIPAGNFLQALWSQDGKDARQEPATAAGAPASASPSGSGSGTASPAPELSFAAITQTQPPLRHSLLSQSRQPSSPNVNIRQVAPAVDAPYLVRETDPSSPSARALQEHAPGQSLPGGIAAALSRMHMQPQQRVPSGLGTPAGDTATPPPRREDHDEDELFHMEG